MNDTPEYSPFQSDDKPPAFWQRTVQRVRNFGRTRSDDAAPYNDDHVFYGPTEAEHVEHEREQAKAAQLHAFDRQNLQREHALEEKDRQALVVGRAMQLDKQHNEERAELHDRGCRAFEKWLRQADRAERRASYPVEEGNGIGNALLGRRRAWQDLRDLENSLNPLAREWFDWDPKWGELYDRYLRGDTPPNFDSLPVAKLVPLMEKYLENGTLGEDLCRPHEILALFRERIDLDARQAQEKATNAAEAEAMLASLREEHRTREEMHDQRLGK